MRVSLVAAELCLRVPILRRGGRLLRVNPVTEAFARLRVVPVVVLERAEDAAALGQALKTGGLPCAEITFRTDAAEEALRTLSRDDDLLVGAGTVLSAEQVDRALEAGARFIVTPGFSPAVVERCRVRGVVVYPGVATPTEIQMALEVGVTEVKFFPAEPAGGARALQAIAAPYSMMRFIPTGGITPANLKGYLEQKAVLAVGGSWLVAPELIAVQDFEEIRRRTAAAVQLVKPYLVK
ncbi:MAG: bifunctional 4-hydroxy-2-oxoglutarate aldolase/2-dehydro-3-deoxy-phosphogluconate aldolase [Chloroflexi bacterium]|nr:bifunctional 4-hydroxy-2-oxoglutarate aldolase/2-dehydro-3-deoxy-phosphogluconate aldolase [Chloroflexota bacterium]